MAASSRILTYDALRGSADLGLLVGDRIGPASSFNKHNERPLVVIRAHTDFPAGRRVGRREYIQIWAHDEPGDYLRIDQVLKLCRVAIEGIVPSAALEDFLEAKWIETGVDLRDDLMESITRYSRFQFTFTRRETL
jgi:hypothetical protein